MPKSDAGDPLFMLVSGESWIDLSFCVGGTTRFSSGKGRQLDLLTCKPMGNELLQSDLNCLRGTTSDSYSPSPAWH